jgi:hypothetical protein
MLTLAAGLTLSRAALSFHFLEQPLTPPQGMGSCIPG